jgi:hypothetical protein
VASVQVATAVITRRRNLDYPKGKVFHAGPAKQMHWIDTSGNGSVLDSILRGNDNDAINGNAVMLYDTGKILTLGGAAEYDSAEASNWAYIEDINNADNVQVQHTGSMVTRRTFCSSIVLLMGHVVVPVTYIFSPIVTQFLWTNCGTLIVVYNNMKAEYRIAYKLCLRTLVVLLNDIPVYQTSSFAAQRCPLPRALSSS